MFEQKIRYLSGVETFKVTGGHQTNLYLFGDECDTVDRQVTKYRSNVRSQQIPSNSNQSITIDTYQITSYGLNVNNLILRLLLGNIGFYNRISKQFFIESHLS